MDDMVIFTRTYDLLTWLLPRSEGFPKPQRFVVQGKYGPLHEGELERAKAWGAELARKWAQSPAAALATP